MQDELLNIRYHNTKQGSQSMLFALCNDLNGTGFYSSGGDGWIVHWPNPMEDEGLLIAKTSEQIMTLFLDEESGSLMAGTLDGHIIAINLTDNSFKKVKVMKGGVFGFIKNELGYYVVGDNGSLTQFSEEYKALRGLQISSSRCRAISFMDEFICVGTSEGRIFKIDPFRMTSPVISSSNHTGSVFSIIQDQDRVISAGKDGKILVWDSELNKIDEIQAHNTTINSIVTLGDSGIMASACRDGSIRLWGLKDLELLKVIDLYLHSGHLRSVNKLIWNDCHSVLISCSDDKKIKTWSIV